MPVPTHSGTMPVASKNRKWDAGAARKNVAVWASSDGSGDKAKVDFKKYGKAFTWYPEGADNFGDFKLPHHDVIDGALVLVPRGLYAAMQRLENTDMPAEDRRRAESHLRSHYRKDLEERPPDSNAFLARALGEYERYGLAPEELEDVDGD